MNFIEKVETLPTPVKDYLKSNDSRLELEKSCFLFGIPDENIKYISKEIGLVFVGEIKLETLPQVISQNLKIPSNVAYGIAFEINRRIFNRFPEFFINSQTLLTQWSQVKSNPILSDQQAQQKLLEVEPWIKEDELMMKQEQKHQEEEQRKYLSSLEEIDIQTAIKKYPSVGEQIITSSSIKLSYFPDLVRASIKNWISDYTLKLGYKSHSSIERGNYLFQTENTRKLDDQDRARLGHILKSFDEKSPLTINTATKQVIFPRPEELKEKTASPQNIKTSELRPERPSPIAKPKPLASSAPYVPTTQSKSNFSNFLAASEDSYNLEDSIKKMRPEEKTPRDSTTIGKIEFSSPQKLSMEKKQNLPHRITPVFDKKPANNPKPLPKKFS